MKHKCTQRTVHAVNRIISHILNFYITTISCNLYRNSSTNFNCNFTLRVVEKEVIVEQVIETFLHILSNFYIFNRFYSLIRKIETITFVTSVNTITIMTLSSFISHKTIVTTSYAISKVFSTPLTFRSNWFDEEQLTNRKVHCLYRYDVISKKFAEYTSNKWEYNSFKRTTIVRSCCFIDKVFCLILI